MAKKKDKRERHDAEAQASSAGAGQEVETGTAAKAETGSAAQAETGPAATTGTGSAEKMKRKEYEHEMRILHGELVAMQEWVKESGAKICIVFEGRDTAGKGGTIKRITERVSPRVFRSSRCPLRPNGKSRKCTSSGTSRTFRPPARS